MRRKTVIAILLLALFGSNNFWLNQYMTNLELLQYESDMENDPDSLGDDKILSIALDLRSSSSADDSTYDRSSVLKKVNALPFIVSTRHDGRVVIDGILRHKEWPQLAIPNQYRFYVGRTAVSGKLMSSHSDKTVCIALQQAVSKRLKQYWTHLYLRLNAKTLQVIRISFNDQGEKTVTYYNTGSLSINFEMSAKETGRHGSKILSQEISIDTSSLKGKTIAGLTVSHSAAKPENSISMSSIIEAAQAITPGLSPRNAAPLVPVTSSVAPISQIHYLTQRGLLCGVRFAYKRTLPADNPPIFCLDLQSANGLCYTIVSKRPGEISTPWIAKVGNISKLAIRIVDTKTGKTFFQTPFMDNTVTKGPYQHVLRDNWLVCGPFPVIDSKSIDKDFLSNKGGEASIHPKDGMTHPIENISQIDRNIRRWSSIRDENKQPILRSWSDVEPEWLEYEHSNLADKYLSVDFDNNYRININVICYAYTEIVSEKDQKVHMLLGYDDKVKVWLNKKVVYTDVASNKLAIDKHSQEISLKKGNNPFLIKVEQRHADHGFVVRFVDQEGDFLEIENE